MTGKVNKELQLRVTGPIPVESSRVEKVLGHMVNISK